MLETTQYNYKESSKYYKELMNSGLSKFMPMVSLGHAQSSVLNLAYFENEILNLPAMMIPPLMSSTMNGEDILGTIDNQILKIIQKAEQGDRKKKKVSFLKKLFKIKNLCKGGLMANGSYQYSFRGYAY